MKCVKKYYNLPEMILSANLDYPNEKTKTDTDIINISGWVAKSKNDPASVAICIKTRVGSNNEQSYTAPLIIAREDVVEKILHGNSLGNELPGFSIKIPFIEQCNIYIVIGDVEFLWCEVLLEEDLDSRELHADWVQMNAIEGDSKTPSPLSEKSKTWLINTCDIFYDSSNVQEKLSLKNEEKKVFDSFIERVLRWDFVLELSQYKERQYIRSCFNNNESQIIGSVNTGNLNILKISDGERIYYIFQNASACDGIYLPACNKLFCLSHLTLNEYKAFIDTIHLFPGTSTSSEFGGFLTFFNRPYHYMYDMLLGYYYAYSHGYLSKSDVTISKPGSDFLDFSKIFNLEKRTKILSGLNDMDGKFYLRLGINFGDGANDCKKLNHIKHLDAHILNGLSDNESSKSQSDIYSIWFGITSQKRSWLEQVDAIIYIINNIEIKSAKLRIVLDGWTSPHSKTHLDEKEITSDMQLASEIIAGVERDVDFINVVGSTIEEKISVARDINIFVANYSTGSLNVARICKKKGIGHISNAFINGASGQHIHSKTVYVDSKDVVDVPSSKGIDHFSYSIKKEVMFNLVQGLINNEN